MSAGDTSPIIPRYCNHIHPDGGDFPARCGLKPEHGGQHEAIACKVSLGGPIGIIDPDITWTNTDTDAPEGTAA